MQNHRIKTFTFKSTSDNREESIELKQVPKPGTENSFDGTKHSTDIQSIGDFELFVGK